MTKENKKYCLLNVLIIILIVIFFLTGCKSKQIISERTISVVDSTAIMFLQKQLSEREKTIELLKTDLERSRDEVSKLRSETSSHTINYDTSAPVNPETGKYPVSSETISHTKQQLDKTIRELVSMKSDYEKVITAEREENTSIQKEVSILKKENSELKTKTIPTTGFNFKLAFWSFIAGILVATLFFFRKKIKKVFNL